MYNEYLTIDALADLDADATADARNALLCADRAMRAQPCPQSLDCVLSASGFGCYLCVDTDVRDANQRALDAAGLAAVSASAFRNRLEMAGIDASIISEYV